MKKIITLLFMVGLFITAYPQSYHTISIDGTNSGWTASEKFLDCSNADTAYFTWDADYLYFGISDPEADYGNMATFMYFDTDPDGISGTTDAYAWGDDITAPFNADYVVVWKNSDDYIEIRHWDGTSWQQVASSNSSSLNSGDYVVNFSVVDGNDYREVKIKRSTIGSPTAIKVASFTEQQWSNNYRYFAWPSEGWTDGNRAIGQSIPHYRGFILTGNISPNNATYYDDNICSWTGTLNNDWGTSTNWSGITTAPTSTDLVIIGSGNPVVNESPSTPGSCFDLLIKSGASLTINAGKALTINSTLTNNANTSDFLIKSEATGTGSIIVNCSVTGDATVQRYMTNYTIDTNGWHFLSAPVSNFTISGSDFEPTAGDDDLYEWDESTNTWLNYIDGTFGDSQFQTGKGYLVAYKSAATKEFTGNINTGTFSKNLSFTSGSAGEGWNLLGNPYTSAIDWDLLTNSASVDGSVYVLRASDGAYISWNGTTGGLTNGIIPAMQGYFVKATATGQSVTMEPADQVHSSTNFYKSGKELAENTFYITVNGNNGESNAYIQFRDDATKTFDHAFDAYKLFGYSTAPQIYTNDGENIYSINCLPSDIQSYSLPVGVKISASDEYQISFNGIENVSDNFDIKLEDLQTGEQIAVNPETTHKFTANEGDDPNRFVLHFYNVTSTPEIGEANNKALIYSYNNNIIVKATDKQLNGKVEIINILGQTMETKSVSNSNFLTINTNLNKGVYIVRYSETDGYTQSQKVIIN